MDKHEMEPTGRPNAFVLAEDRIEIHFNMHGSRANYDEMAICWQSRRSRQLNATFGSLIVHSVFAATSIDFWMADWNKLSALQSLPSH